MNRILFIGGYYNPQILPYLIKNSKHGLDFAANNLQEAIFKGLDENHVDYDIISFPFVGSFPLHSKSPFIKSYNTHDKRIQSVGYVNIMYFKRWHIRRLCWSKVKEWCNLVKGKGTIIFYNFSNICIAKRIKEKFPEIKIVLIVTDLPEFMSTDKSLTSRINDKLLRFNSNTFHNNIDGYILIAERMQDRMPIANKPKLVIEGIYNSTVAVDSVEKEPNKTILYTGTLGERYGIKKLLEAFSCIKDDSYRLWIRGNGQCESDVKEASQRDGRIVYFDKMSRKELLELEKKATLLINPVAPSQVFTSYFFPSKTLEYMASGTPTLMHKLSCLPEGYLDYIYTFENEDVESIKNKIVEICSMNADELAAFGAKASNYILKNKTPKPQIERLITFIATL